MQRISTRPNKQKRNQLKICGMLNLLQTLIKTRVQPELKSIRRLNKVNKCLGQGMVMLVILIEGVMLWEWDLLLDQQEVRFPTNLRIIQSLLLTLTTSYNYPHSINSLKRQKNSRLFPINSQNSLIHLGLLKYKNTRVLTLMIRMLLSRVERLL